MNNMNKSKLNTKGIVLLGLLSSLSYLSVFLFRIPVVSFLKYEPKDIFIVIGAFLFGPLAGLLMSIVVSFLEMVTISTTGPIGMLMNIISTVAFASTAAFIYQKKRTMSGAVIGLTVGALLMTGLMLLWNYLITPLYMGVPRNAVVDMLIPVFLPFNLVKAGINATLTLLLYKPLKQALTKGHLLPQVEKQAEGSKSKNWLGLMLASLFVLGTCIFFVLVLNETIRF